MERMKHYLSICNSGPSEALAGIALKNRQSILEHNNALVRANLDLLDDFFAEFRHLFEWRRPDGGCIGYPRYLGAGSVDDFCTRLVQQSGVLLLPAGIYSSKLGPTPRDHFRIGFGRKGVADGISAFREHGAADRRWPPSWYMASPVEVNAGQVYTLQRCSIGSMMMAPSSSAIRLNNDSITLERLCISALGFATACLKRSRAGRAFGFKTDSS